MTLSTATLAKNGTATFTVQPKAGLAVGSHNATLTITTGNSTSASVSLAFGVTSKTHEHSYGTDWKSDTTNHWHECTAGDNAKSELAPHTYGAWNITIPATSTTAGSKTRTCTVCAYAQTESIPATGSGSTGGGSGGNSGSGKTDVTPPSKPNTPTTGTIPTLPGKPDKNGSISIPGGKVEDAINEAVKAAEKSGQTQNGVAVAVNLPTGTTSATLDRAALDKLIASGVKSFKMNFNGVALSFDLPALKEIAGKTTATLSFGASKATGLTGDALAAIGTRPAYNLTVGWQANGKTAYLSSFGAGRVSVAIAYTPAKGELTGSLYAVYVNSGKAEWIDKSSYDSNSKAVIFQTGHFSTFGVGYKTPPAFADTVSHWAKEDIAFVAARNLLSGTSATAFSPDTAMTRGMFVTALHRLAGTPQAGEGEAFTDVLLTAYYSEAVKWAVQSGIVSGTSATTFAPDKAITRQEMAVIMQNYAKAMNYTLPQTRTAVTFADNSSIGSWAAAAVKQMQMAGIINGKDGNKFDPTGTATRAEVSAVLRRYVELVVDPATAQGLSVNDSGSTMLYESGKPVKSQSRTVNGTTYKFNANGEAALPPAKKTNTYIVQKGDSFWSIARKYKVSMFELVKINGKGIFSSIRPGDVLQVPQ